MRRSRLAGRRSKRTESHRPKRSCLGCGRRDEADRLIRLAVAGNGALQTCRSGKGRGGYLHPDRQCWDAFVKRKSVYRAFHAEISREAREGLVQNLLKPAS